jgi:hypothetical protein
MMIMPFLSAQILLYFLWYITLVKSSVVSGLRALMGIGVSGTHYKNSWHFVVFSVKYLAMQASILIVTRNEAQTKG